MEFREANEELKACLFRGNDSGANTIVRVGDLSAIGLIYFADFFRSYGSNSALHGSVLMTVGLGLLAIRLEQNREANLRIRQDMSTNALAVCLAQTRAGLFAPKPKARFFLPGGLRRVLKSELERRGRPLAKSDRLFATFE